MLKEESKKIIITISTVAMLLAMFIGCGFFWMDARQK